MNTLFHKYNNILLLLLLAFLIRIVFVNLSFLSYVAVLISIHQFILLFNAIGEIIPIRYLFGAFMCLQMLVGPVFAYNGLDELQYPFFRMQVLETTYFSYAIPAVLMFIVGLHARAGNFKGEVLNLEALQEFTERRKSLPYILIALGFISSIVAGFFSSDLAFVLYLVGGFKFIGAFLLILDKDRMNLIPIVLVSASIISSSLSEGMFHDLLIWTIFIGAMFCIKYKPRVSTKLIFSITFIFLAIIIQQLKSNYRTATKFQGKQAGIETYIDVYKGQQKKGLFNFQSLAPHNVRINQGFIITYIMKTVPEKVPFSNGTELGQILEAAVLPRFLAPNKLNAGDRQIFTRYTGLALREGTSMGLSAAGDAYINFGVLGGCLFMFLLGLLYSETLNIFGRYSQNFPLLIIFSILVFYFPIRPDTEFQTLLGHFVKSCFLIFIIFRFWKEMLQVEGKESQLQADKAQLLV